MEASSTPSSKGTFLFSSKEYLKNKTDNRSRDGCHSSFLRQLLPRLPKQKTRLELQKQTHQLLPRHLPQRHGLLPAREPRQSHQQPRPTSDRRYLKVGQLSLHHLRQLHQTLSRHHPFFKKTGLNHGLDGTCRSYFMVLAVRSSPQNSFSSFRKADSRRAKTRGRVSSNSDRPGSPCLGNSFFQRELVGEDQNEQHFPGIK